MKCFVICLLVGTYVFQYAYCKLPLVAIPMPAMITASNLTSELTRKNLSMLALINYSGAAFTLGTICTTGIQTALEQVRRNRNILPDYNLMVEPIDDAATRAFIVSRTIGKFYGNEMSTHRIPIMIGSLFAGSMYSGQIINHYNFLGVTASSPMPSISLDRNKYKHFYVLAASTTAWYEALAEFIGSRGWRKLSIISEVSPYCDMQENAMIRRMDKLGIALEGYFKLPLVSGSFPDEDDLNWAVRDLAKLQPRIIVTNSNGPARLACFLHRYGLYGPDYVIFWTAITAFLPIDPTRFKWCSEKMLSEVLESSFLFGDATKGELFGVAFDSSGMSNENFDQVLKDNIDRPESLSVWNGWRHRCYEMTLFATYWLNAVDLLLKSRNETLSEWVTGSEKFKTLGQEYVRIATKALYTFRLEGFAGNYEYSEKSESNDKGYLPIAFHQVRKEVSQNGVVSFTPVPLAIANAALESFAIKSLPNRIMWRTFDGMQPPDSIQIVQMLVPLINDSAYGAMSAIGALVILASGGLLVLQAAIAKKRSDVSAFKMSLPSINAVILIGDCVMACHTFLLPRVASPNVHINCSVIYGLIIIGGSLVFVAIYAKFEIESAMFFAAMPRSAASMSSTHRRLTDAIAHSVTQSPNKSLALIVIWLGVQILLCVLWLTVDPVTSVLELGDTVTSTHGSSLCYQLTSYECIAPNTDGSYVPIGLISALNCFILLRSLYLGVFLQSKQPYEISDYKQVWMCFAGSLTSLFAVVILCIIFWSNAGHLQLVISAFVLFLSILNIGAIFVPKVIFKGVYYGETMALRSAAFGTVGQTASRMTLMSFQRQSQRAGTSVGTPVPSINRQSKP